MTCSTYTKKAQVFHALYIVLLSAAGVLAAYSAVYTFSHISCREDVIAGGFTVFFALLLLSVDFFECRAMSAKLYVNEDGMGVRRFGKTKVFIRWDDIREIGTGSIPTPFGSKERVYFCDRMLEEGQRSDLITLKYHTVHFSYIPRDWYPEMNRRLPVPIPKELADRYVR